MDPTYEKIAGIEYLKVEGSGDKTIILFHGYGASASDLLPLHNLDKNYTWIFPQGPLKVAMAGNAWFPVDIEMLQMAVLAGDAARFEDAFPDQTDIARTKLQSFLDALKIPEEKCIFGGFSQGAVVAIEMALLAKQKIGALLILSGTLLNEKVWASLMPSQSGLPFFQSHGRYDPLLPYKRAELLEHVLHSGGLQGTLYGFDGGHEIPPDALDQMRSFLNDI